MQKTPFIDIITFIFLGISSLIGWSAVSSSFFFFATKYGNRVYTNFTFPLEMGNCFWGIMMPYLASRLSVLQRISGCLLIQSAILIAFPIIAQFQPNETGYTISMILTFFIGSFQSIGQNSMIALAGQEGNDIIGNFWFATGLSGLIMATLTMILTVIFSPTPEGQLSQTIVFFAFACCLSFIATYLVCKYVSRKAIKRFVQDDQEPNEEIVTIHNLLNQSALEMQGQSLVQSAYVNLQSSVQSAYNETKEIEYGFQEKVRDAFYHLRLIPIFIFLTYGTSFLLFPGITNSDIQFTSKFLNENSQLWGSLFLNFTYNFGDTIGKYIGGFPILQKRSFIYTLTIVRMVCIPLAFTIALGQGTGILITNWFPFVNLLFIGLTNGICTTSLFALGAQQGKGDMRIIENIAFLCGFALTFGLATGSFLAYAVDPHTVINYLYDPVQV